MSWTCDTKRYPYIKISTCFDLFCLWSHLNSFKSWAPCCAFGIVGMLLTSLHARCLFCNFFTNEAKFIEVRLIFYWKLIKNYKIDFFNQSMPLHSYWYLNSHLSLHITWKNSFALPWHGGNAWKISCWPSSHLVISTNHCIFMAHEEMHLLFHVMGKCMRNFPLVIKLAIFPFSHLYQSMLFQSWTNAFVSLFH